MELSLEPLTFEPARVDQRALFEAGILVTAFTTADITSDYAGLTTLGVVARATPVISTVFRGRLRQPRATADDTADRLSRSSA